MAVTRNCLICGKPPVILGARYSQSFLAKCRDCNLVFSSLIPSEDELHQHYSQYSRNADVSQLTTSVYDTWIQNWRQKGYSTHLDFGCGSGDLVDYANRQGFDSVGIEINLEVNEKIAKRGIPVKSLDSILIQPETYDVITIIEVIEHVCDPKSILEALYKKLSKNGIVFITSPNFDSLNRYLLKNRWRALWYPDHINIFNKSSIERILFNSGFSNVHVKTSGHIILDLIPNQVEGSKSNSFSIENQRNYYARNNHTRKLKEILNQVLNWTKLGDTLVVTATKE
jgi:2-polyprenyl-3-methyl-5-hydroxy-6-metoxy-1,4-benzoquinol methylase